MGSRSPTLPGSRRERTLRLRRGSCRTRRAPRVESDTVCPPNSARPSRPQSLCRHSNSSRRSPNGLKSVYDSYVDRAARADAEVGGDGGPTPAAVNPPLYYLWECRRMRSRRVASLFARVTAMRLWTFPFLLVTVAATWLLAGTVFGPRQELQLAAAAVPALFPMVGFISSSINPDGLLYALWSIALSSRRQGSAATRRIGGPDRPARRLRPGGRDQGGFLRAGSRDRVGARRVALAKPVASRSRGHRC